MSRQINIVIDRIVLDTPMSRRERAALADAVSEQLTALVGGRPLGQVGGSTGRLSQQIARAVHAALPVQQLGRPAGRSR